MLDVFDDCIEFVGEFDEGVVVVILTGYIYTVRNVVDFLNVVFEVMEVIAVEGFGFFGEVVSRGVYFFIEAVDGVEVVVFDGIVDFMIDGVHVNEEFGERHFFEHFMVVGAACIGQVSGEGEGCDERQEGRYC